MIRIGPAGWSYDDWWGRVYPHPAPRGFDPLEYLARYFDTIEINSSFYRPPTTAMTRRWVARVGENPRFKFTAKLYRKFTHERTPTPEDEASFKRGMEPLVEAGKLGAVLLQFPWSFKNTPDAREYISELVRRFAEYPLVVEVRHASWNVESVYEFFREHNVGFCNIDQPVFRRSLGPTRRVTAPVGYVRLHGRNYDNWFSESATAAARYDYLYSHEELKPWIENIRAIAQTAADVYVITNNHYQGKGVVNALELKADIEGTAVPVPEPLIRAYPRLESLALTTDFSR
ncbi:MAG TPA: DUF72 domain-containing protein [Blastocatellia bacterium]|nr:DUF72 domain-containing protein [Blastocatellia bacterium]